ncbi:hypothetical protein D3C71_2058300 [compost metagenome]
MNPRPAGSAGIQQPGALREHRRSESAHRFREAGNFLYRLALDTQRSQQSANLRRRRGSFHYRPHYFTGLRPAEVMPLN